MKLGFEERSVAELREHRKIRQNSIFDAEYASQVHFVIKSWFLNDLLKEDLRFIYDCVIVSLSLAPYTRKRERRASRKEIVF